MPEATVGYQFSLPTVAGDASVWGGFLNDNWTKLDNLLRGATALVGTRTNNGQLLGTTALVAGHVFSGVATFSGQLAVVNTSNLAPTPTSTGHAAQFGPTNGFNTRIGRDTIQSALNGAPAILRLNPAGGVVDLGPTRALAGGGIRIGGDNAINELDRYEETAPVMGFLSSSNGASASSAGAFRATRVGRVITLEGEVLTGGAVNVLAADEFVFSSVPYAPIAGLGLMSKGVCGIYVNRTNVATGVAVIDPVNARLILNLTAVRGSFTYASRRLSFSVTYTTSA